MIKKIIDFIAEALLNIAILFSICFVLYVFFKVSYLPLIILSVCPILLFGTKRGHAHSLSINQAKQINNFCTIAGILSAIIILFNISFYESYISKKIMKGKVHSETETYQNEEGEEQEKTVYYFSPKEKSESYKKDIILFSLAVLIFGGGYYLFQGSTNLLNEVYEIDRIRKEKEWEIKQRNN